MSRECVICLADWDADSKAHAPAVLECGHVFGWKCAQTWLAASPICPVCKQPATVDSLKPLPAPAVDGVDARDLGTTLQKKLREVGAQEARTREGYRRRADCVAISSSMRGYVGHIIANAGYLPPPTAAILPVYSYTAAALLTGGATFEPRPARFATAALHRGHAWAIAADACWVWVVSPQRGLRRRIQLPFVPNRIVACARNGRVVVYNDTKLAGIEGAGTAPLFVCGVPEGVRITCAAICAERDEVLLAQSTGEMATHPWVAAGEVTVAGAVKIEKPPADGSPVKIEQTGKAVPASPAAGNMENVVKAGARKRERGALSIDTPPAQVIPAAKRIKKDVHTTVRSIDNGREHRGTDPQHALFNAARITGLVQLRVHGRVGIAALGDSGVGLRRGRQAPWTTLLRQRSAATAVPLGCSLAHLDDMRVLVAVAPSPGCAGGAVYLWQTHAIGDGPAATQQLGLSCEDLRHVAIVAAPTKPVTPAATGTKVRATGPRGVSNTNRPSTRPTATADVIVIDSDGEIDVDGNGDGGKTAADVAHLTENRVFLAHSTAQHPNVVFWRSLSSPSDVLQTTEAAEPVVAIASDANYVLITTADTVTWYLILT